MTVDNLPNFDEFLSTLTDDIMFPDPDTNWTLDTVLGSPPMLLDSPEQSSSSNAQTSDDTLLDFDGLPPAPWEVNDRPPETLPQLLPFEGADVKRTEGMITFSRGSTRPTDGLKMIHSVSLFGKDNVNFQFKPVSRKDSPSKAEKIRRGPYKTKRRLRACEKMKASLVAQNVAPKFMCLNCFGHVANHSQHICQEQPKAIQ